jgi:cobalamin-dependent methionine synthase I
VLVIAEKINGTRKLVNKAILARDAEHICMLARTQVEAGADVIDVNAGTSPDREPEDMVWLIKLVQETVDKPLCLDSPNPEALAAGIEVCAQPPMINSISAEPYRLAQVLPLVAKNGLKTVALALESNIISPTCEGRMKVIRRLFEETRKAGIPDERIYMDALVMTIATDNKACSTTLETMRATLAEYPNAHVTGGLSNVSFGLPARSLINRTFLTLAMSAGMDSAIIDPTDKGLMETLYAADAVLGRDRCCMRYSRAYRAGRIGQPAAPKAAPKPEQVSTEA